MDDGLTLECLITALFGVTGLYFLVRVAWGFSWIDRVNSLTHVAMSAVMITMQWPALPAPSGILQIALFAAAALWYVYLLASRRGAGRAPLLGHHGASAALLGYHVFMMASMVWMVFATSAAAPPAPGARPGATARGMPGMPGMVTDGAAGAALSPAQAAAVSFAVGAVFAAAAIWFAVLFAARLATRARRRTTRRLAAAALLDAAGGTVMSAGMALTFLLVMA